MKKTLLYFGPIGGPGHYLWSSERNKPREDGFPMISKNLLTHLDGTFPPKTNGYEDEGLYNDCIVPPCRIVAWWDRSCDKRHMSNSTLIGVGYVTAEEIIDDAYNIFPSVMNRQKRPVPFLTPTPSE